MITNIKILFALILTCFSTFSTAVSLREEEQFLTEAAYERMMNASTREDFLLTAGLYRKLIASGTRNGEIFYNLGTALLAAGDAPSAMQAFQRAERYDGFNSDVAANMLTAHRMTSDDIEAVLPWQRTPLFWHYGVPFNIRLMVACLAFLAFWICLALKSMGLRRAMSFALPAALLFMIFGSSAITSASQEYIDRQMDYAIALEQTKSEIPAQ